MDSKYDAIVVGAGNGGMTASAALAQKGLDVLLLERHNIPGGCATSFCRGRFEFEVALHQLSGMGTAEQPGPLRLMLGSLGVVDDLEFVEMPDLYNVAMPGGFSLSLSTKKDEVIATLKERFPEASGAIDEFFDLVYRYANEFLGAFYFKDPEASREKYPTLYAYAFKTAAEVLDRMFTDPLLKAIVSVYWGYLGLPPTRLSFAYIAMLYFTYMEFKPFHLKGGSQALSNAIVNRFIANGGTVRYNCGVKEIIVEGGRVRGVITENGERIASDYVVSNASQVSTYVQLIAPGLVPKEALTEMGGRSLSPSAFVLFIGLDCEPEAVGITETTNFLLENTGFTDEIFNQMRRLEIGDQLLVMSCYDVADRDFSPPGTCQLNVVTLKYGEPWLRVPASQYARVKYRCGEGMLNRVKAVYPEMGGHIEELEVATPLTHMRYLGHPFGAIYGFEEHMKDTMFFQPGRESPIDGLYFAGGWSGDCGFQPTLEAGMSAAKGILKELGVA